MSTEAPIQVLRDIGLVCPVCGWNLMQASFAFCPRCTARLPEGWHAEQGVK